MSALSPEHLARLRGHLLNIVATLGTVSEEIETAFVGATLHDFDKRQAIQASIAEAVDAAQMLHDQADAVLGDLEAISDEAEGLQ